MLTLRKCRKNSYDHNLDQNDISITQINKNNNSWCKYDLKMDILLMSKIPADIPRIPDSK